MGVKLRKWEKDTPVDITIIENPPAYEMDERLLKLNEELWNSETIEEENRILKEMDEIENSYRENNTHKEDSI